MTPYKGMLLSLHFYIYNGENMMKSFLSETTKPRALIDIFYVASPGELLPMKLIQIMLREPKMAPRQWS